MHHVHSTKNTLHKLEESLQTEKNESIMRKWGDVMLNGKAMRHACAFK